MQSPIPLMNFNKALTAIAMGKKVTKLEWADPEYYGVLYEERLKLHKPDGKYYDWIISEADMAGEDYQELI